MYFSNRNIRGYNSPIEIYITSRGRGKTFGEVKNGVQHAIDDPKNKKFIYVVENAEMIKTLTQNRGERFFSSLINFYESNSSRRNDKFLAKLKIQAVVDDGKATITTKIMGGTIYVDNVFVGYILALNDFAQLKRNNFVGFSKIIIDEFIPEKITMHNFDNPRKLASLVQSIARTTTNIKIVLLGNSVSRSCPVLTAFKLQDLKNGEIRVIKDKFGVLLVAYMENTDAAKEFKEVADVSISGRLNAYIKEDNLEKNIFKDENIQLIPHKKENSRLKYILKLEQGDFKVNLTETGAFYIYKSETVCNRKILWLNNFVCSWRGNCKPLFISAATRGKIFCDTQSTASIIYKELNLVL